MEEVQAPPGEGYHLNPDRFIAKLQERNAVLINQLTMTEAAFEQSQEELAEARATIDKLMEGMKDAEDGDEEPPPGA
jgi:PHD/YefM family antitoxin component YafN of YafNO toxin-antitoxin module